MPDEPLDYEVLERMYQECAKNGPEPDLWIGWEGGIEDCPQVLIDMVVESIEEG